MSRVLLRTDDLHSVLGRLLDRLRVSGIVILKVSAELVEEGYDIAVEIACDDSAAIQRLPAFLSHVVGVTDVRTAFDVVKPRQRGALAVADLCHGS